MLQTYLDTIEQRRKRFTVYSDQPAPDLPEQLATRNVTVEQRQLPPTGPPPFVAIHDGDEFVGAISVDSFQELLAPPIVRPGDWDGLADGYRTILTVLSETLFTALDRRQLLATSREIEDRALRVGEGTLRVSFQSFAVFSTQLNIYTTLGEETDLDIHIYGTPDWSPPSIQNVTYHRDETGDLALFWCLAFDGGPDETQACVLVAQEQTEGYRGFWSYDRSLATDVLRTLEAAES